ncbi:Response regulator protein VraR [Pontiella desulfatans]|uniref:Response regulator protein VraR n=1 Tax=Pontiella desulfatans TaxID=2750659 RepID=A0A6C2U8X0_PONDE|nr:response regulator transcription factor [Pontiella desulfatans]VGO16415.1 Response regulator protein VraR [Pontiella desulfatans]
MIPMTVWVVEDDSVYRRSLEGMFERREKITCAHTFPSCIEFLEAVEQEPHPDIVLMDLGLPKMSGIEGIKRLKKRAPEITVLVLTTFKEKEAVLEALENGAAGYLLKTATEDEIINGIRDIFMGQSVLSPSVARIVLEEIRRPAPEEAFNLSDREIEVLEHLAEDLAPKEIAARLDITVRTARFHLSNIYEKLQVSSQTGAVAKALRSGII